MQLASISGWAFLLITVAAPALVFFIGQLAFHSEFLRTTSDCDAWVERYFQLSEDAELDDVKAAREALVEKFRIAMWYTSERGCEWEVSNRREKRAPFGFLSSIAVLRVDMRAGGSDSERATRSTDPSLPKTRQLDRLLCRQFMAAYDLDSRCKPLSGADYPDIRSYRNNCPAYVKFRHIFVYSSAHGVDSIAHLVPLSFLPHPRHVSSPGYKAMERRRPVCFSSQLRVKVQRQGSASLSLFSGASPLLIGSLLVFFFFGTFLAQVLYFLLLGITVSICLIASDVQAWYGYSFGDIISLVTSKYTSFYERGLRDDRAYVLLLCYRIFLIRRAVWPLCVLIALITIAQLAGGMRCGILSFYRAASRSAKDITGLHDKTHMVLIYLWLIGGPVADVLIAIAMTTLCLLKTEIHAATRDIMKDVVHLILETNTFSAAVTLVALFLFIGFPNTPYFGCAVIILPGVYANTLLATLNNRAIILRIQDQRSEGDCCEISDGEGRRSWGTQALEALRACR
ncbi:hypothetical protein B0H14DRAFT_3577560 [Mycena olivaceomarginata]|nr:hypothetical protein B0H14DRAFT_3577560 [Mycena olivaceomarginata]